MKLLEGKVAIVTGAARGIGEGIVIKLAEQGANIAFTYVSNSSADKAKALEEKLIALGVKAKAYQSNAGDYAACEAFVADTVKEFGTVDICVNSAGISKDNLLLRMTPEQWGAVINTNLSSLFNMCRPVIEGMRSRKFGRIINISSINGQKGQVGQANYSAAKAGELGFTKALAQESARSGITVNAVCPGYIATEMVKAVPQDVLEKNILPHIPIGRLGEPEEIARCVAFLASDDAGFITGATLTANGGQYLA